MTWTTMTKTWTVFKAENGLHVMPDSDMIEHEKTEDCICGPAQELENNVWIYAHMSLDNREGES